MKKFEDVRNWKAIRGVGANNNVTKDVQLQSQFQRVMQEVIEIHDALVKNDVDEFKDAIGDTIVTLINIAAIAGHKAEDCLDLAFSEIELRKGLTSDTGDFVRYAKLSKEDQKICDEKQGNPGSDYFDRSSLQTLKPENFKK